MCPSILHSKAEFMRTALEARLLVALEWLVVILAHQTCQGRGTNGAADGLILIFGDLFPQVSKVVLLHSSYLVVNGDGARTRF